MDDNLRRLRRGADEIQRKHNVIAKNLRRHYYLSILGNVLGVLATITANRSSGRLSSVFYIFKYIVWFVSLKPFERENTTCEDQIKKAYDRVIQKDGPQDSKQGVFASFISRISRKLHYTVPFILVLDIHKIYKICKIIHLKKKLAVTENIQRLNALVTDAGNTVAMQKNKIENLAPFFENVKDIVKSIDNKAGHVVKLIPGIAVPDNRNINDALHKKLIRLRSKPPFIGPVSDKKYLHLKKEIEKAKYHKNNFDKNAFSVLKSARKCLQSSFEAKKLPTFTFTESQENNLELLKETKISLDAIKEIGGELQHLQLDKQENQQALVTGLATMLDNATETLANVSEFNIDIKSKLERASVKRAAKKVVGYAKKGGRINHQVDETVTSMKIANKAMKVVEKKTSRFWGRIKPVKMNEIKQQKEAENIWHNESLHLAESVSLLARHADDVLHSPENIIKETSENYKPKMVEQAREIATETLNIYDQVENFKSNLNCQVPDFKRVFQRIWSSSDEATELQLEVVNMRSEAARLRLKMSGDKTIFSKLLAALCPVDKLDKLSLLVSFSCIGFYAFNLYRLPSIHPKEKILRNEIDRLLGDDGQVHG